MTLFSFHYLSKKKGAIIVFSLFFILFSVLLALLDATVVDQNGFPSFVNSGFYLMFSSIYLMIMTVFFPFLVNKNAKKKESDLEDNPSQQTKNTTLLISSLIILFLGLSIYILIVFIRQSLDFPKIINPEQKHVFYNYFYFFPAFIVMCLYGVINYTVSTFLIARGSNFIKSLIYLVMGQLALTFLVSIPLWFISIFVKVIAPDSSFLFSFMFSPALYSSSMIGSIEFINVMFFGLIEEGYEIVNARIAATLSGNIFPSLLYFICLLAYIVVGVFSYISLKKENEEKVSLFGNFIKNNIIHISFVIAGLCIGYYGAAFPQAKVAFFVLMALLVLAYYPLESLIKGTFKLSKKEIITMSVICVAIVTINLLTYFADLRFIHL